MKIEYSDLSPEERNQFENEVDGDNAGCRRMSLRTALIVISIVLIGLVIVFGNMIIINDNKLVGNEIINKSLDVSGNYGEQPTPLPTSGVYELVGGTSKRGDPKIEIGVDYSYWVYSSQTDKFGYQNTTHLEMGYLMIGTSDDSTNIDKIFSIPADVSSANIVIFSPEHPRKKSSATISVRPTTLPDPPTPPKIGELVNCSSYTELKNDRTQPPEVMQPGVTYSSNGGSWFNVPGHPDYVTFRKSGYSWYASDKYTEYVFPANLTILNKSMDRCKVVE